MNWQAIGFDWNQVRAFLATAEEGSLSGAARALRTTQPTVGRQVAALEDALGVTLFDRPGKRLVLTEGGRRVLAQVRTMGDAAAGVSAAVAGLSSAVEGEVTVTASDLMAAAFLPPILRTLRSQAPGLTVRISADNSIRNLLRREADIAIRHVEPDQPDLVATLVHEAGAGFYGASSYLDAAGRPVRRADLSAHDFVGGEGGEFAAYLAARGYPVTAAQFRTSCTSGCGMWELVRAGLGLSLMPDAVAATDPSVERVLPDEAFGFPVWLVAHRDLLGSRRVQVVFEALEAAFAGGLMAVAPAPTARAAP